MNGLVSGHPSQHAVRLALGGFLLLMVQSLLLLLSPETDDAARSILCVLTPIATVSLIAALVGLPDETPKNRVYRDDR
jgi:hypothetical protein